MLYGGLQEIRIKYPFHYNHDVFDSLDLVAGWVARHALLHSTHKYKHTRDELALGEQPLCPQETQSADS